MSMRLMLLLRIWNTRDAKSASSFALYEMKISKSCQMAPVFSDNQSHKGSKSLVTDIFRWSTRDSELIYLSGFQTFFPQIGSNLLEERFSLCQGCQIIEISFSFSFKFNHHKSQIKDLAFLRFQWNFRRIPFFFFQRLKWEMCHEIKGCSFTFDSFARDGKSFNALA